MTQSELKQALEELHGELLRAGTLPAEQQAKADVLAEAIRGTLESDEFAANGSGLKDPLEDGVAAFEVSHPRITELIEDVLNLLAGLGI